MKARRKRVLFLLLAVFLVFIGIPSVFIAQQLRQESLDWALIQAVRRFDAPAVTHLLDLGASPNARATGREPPTLQRRLTRLWLRFQHKKVNSGSNWPALELLFTNLSLSRRTNSTAPELIAVALIEHGANIHAPVMTHNRTVLDEAARFRMHRTMRVLLSKGADVNVKDDLGITPLMCADTEDSALLIEHGANVNAKDNSGETSLYSAVVCGELARAKLLVKSGADVNVAIASGNSLLYQALVYLKASFDKTEIIRLLKQHGARLNKVDKDAQGLYHVRIPQ